MFDGVAHPIRPGHARRDARLLPGPYRQNCTSATVSTLLNGKLLRVAEEAGFDVLLTADKNLTYRQNLSNRKFAIVALGRNRWSLIRPVLPRIVSAVNAARPGSYVLIEIPAT